MTISNSIEFSGIGLHSGKTVNVTISPNLSNSGIIFYRVDKNIYIPANSNFVVNTKMATVIGSSDATISTIEHFMAACRILNLTQLVISIDGDEFPILDGSAIKFIELLQSGNIVESEDKNVLRILREVSVESNNRIATILPSEHTEYSIDVKFKYFGEQSASLNLSYANNLEEVLSSRTFGYVEEFEYLKSVGLANGATTKNVIGIDKGGKIFNQFGLRNSNELANHKLLDLIGDMTLLGYPFVGHVTSKYGGHELNDLLVKKILSDPKNYKIVTH